MMVIGYIVALTTFAATMFLICKAVWDKAFVEGIKLALRTVDAGVVHVHDGEVTIYGETGGVIDRFGIDARLGDRN